jgi:hypothetical protein
MMKYNTCKITDTKEHPNAFAVMLLSVPRFPDNKPIHSIVRFPLSAVIAARIFEEEWAFVSLSAQEKTCIGDELLKDGKTLFNTWRYCELFELEAAL